MRRPDRPEFEWLEQRILLDVTPYAQPPAGDDPEAGVVRLGLASEPGVIRIQYLVPKLQLERVAVEGSDAVLVRPILPGAELIGKAGQPALPVISARIVLPAGYELGSVEVTPGAPVTLDGSYLIAPAGELVPTDPDATDGFAASGTKGFDMSVYASGSPFPGRLFDVVGVQSRRGVRILTVRLNPVGYVGGTGTVSCFGSLTLSVGLVRTGAQAPAEGAAVRYRPDAIRPLAGDVDNPDALATYEDIVARDIPRLGICDPADSYQYVIVTSSAFAGAATDYTIRDFLAQKQSLGMSATIVTLETVTANYSGLDNAERLRNFIIDAYNHWETDYVLLGGDTNVIPYRSLYCTVDTIVDNLPSDLYYQCLDGTYNYDNDTYWEEPTDGAGGADVDMAAEVYVGRVSAQTEAEMANWVYKTIAYEDNGGASSRWRSAMVGEQLGFGGVSEYAGPAMEEIRLGSDSAGYHTDGFASFPDITVDTLYDSAVYRYILKPSRAPGAFAEDVLALDVPDESRGR